MNAKEMIAKYRRGNGVENDTDTRTAAAGRLWSTGDAENQDFAQKIWGELKLPPREVDMLKEDFEP